MADDDKNKPPIKDRLKNGFSKLKKIKNIELIICIALLAVILLVYGLVREAKKKDEGTAGTAATAIEQTEAQELSRVLSEIKGAGSVNVFISYDGTEETVYAYDSQKNTTVRVDGEGENQLTTTVTEESSVPVFVTVDGVKTPLVSKKLSPKILGVVIVAEGASDISVRLQLIKAAAAALNVNEKIIEIFIMK